MAVADIIVITVPVTTVTAIEKVTFAPELDGFRRDEASPCRA